MSRGVTNKIYRTFVKGLVTEAGPLTYPENASIREDNCIIYRKGNRSRRFGIDYESGFTQSLGGILSEDYINEYIWSSAANRSTLNFLVVQAGLRLAFYDLNTEPVSDGLQAFSVDLTPFITNSTTIAKARKQRVSMASGKGYLFVVGELIEPLIIEYFPETNTVSVERIYIQIRDFKGVNDGLANDEEPTSLTNLHHYNLLNQGWLNPENTGAGPVVSYFDPFGRKSTYNRATDEPIGRYFQEFSRYPGNNKQWWIAKAPSDNEDEDVEAGDFVPKYLSKIHLGNTRAPRGHFIVDAFFVDRSAVSGIQGLPIDVTAERPSSVAFYSGRVWYVCNSTVYFSQVLDDKRKAGFCYQEADPTAEDISDLVATDGGVVPIPEMSRGVHLLAQGSGMLVFADTGTWFVTGTQAGFTASDISVNKVHSVGTDAPGSIVEAEGVVYYWSDIGIIGMQQRMGMFGAVEGSYERTILTETTIQTLYNEINRANHKYVKGCYDEAQNRVYWLFQQADLDDDRAFDRVLILDRTLGAFYPWTIPAANPRMVGLFCSESAAATSDPRVSRLRLLALDETDLYICGMRNRQFLDWMSHDTVGQPFMSYVDTGYELLEDVQRDKMIPYIFIYFRRTEPEMESSCKFQVRWDWATSREPGKWSTKVEAYRHVRPTLFLPDSGYDVVVTKNKVRGTGKAIQFRFESDAIGKDFDLLGWGVNYTGNTVP